MKLSDWIVKDGFCAMRIVKGGNPDNIADRVAFIEKTPRVRVAPFNGAPDGLSEPGSSWKYGPKGSGGPDGKNPNNQLYGFHPPSRAWCDAELIKLGYEL